MSTIGSTRLWRRPPSGGWVKNVRVRRSWVWVAHLLVAVVAGAEEDEVCLECHADPDLVRAGDWRPGTSVAVDPAAIAASMHDGVGCVECHATASVDHPERLPPAACADCHDDVAEEYGGSLHGLALAAGNEHAPTCGDCHGSHDIGQVADASSPVFPTNVPLTCAACHADPAFDERRPLARVSPLAGYRQSVHYRALQGVNGNGATCTDCHGSHALYRPNDPRSRIHDRNIPATCGACHAEIRTVYEMSIHGQALAAGELDAPDCVDCHGEHEIRAPSDSASSVYPARISKTTCVWCHESERLVRRFGLASGRQSSYEDSYHGLADRGGSTTVANCASCHGIHDILPSMDPRSSIHPDHLAQTCGQCHPGAGPNFTAAPIHAAKGLANGEHPVVHLVRRAYLWLIVGLVGAMALHNGVDFARRFHAPRLPRGRQFLRFTVNERLQHAVMAVSFIVLAYSGFALKFPDAWWAAPLAAGGEGTRRLVHRVAAVAMVSVCLYHLLYLALSGRGREQARAMRPRLRDLRDAAQMVGYYLGHRPDRPAYDRFGYVEKLEYWALVWGSAVMTVTGFALWFENQSMAVVPLWGLDLATVIHYYEAWLATLAIVVWHFYWVIFNPEVYPMSLVWLDGHLSEEAMAHEHPRELERLQEADRGDEPG